MPDIHDRARWNMVRHDQRPGQAYFNAAAELDSAFADAARSTGWDPFYRNDNLSEFLTRWHAKHDKEDGGE